MQVSIISVPLGNIPSFERLVDGLFATENTDVYETESNAYLLSTELATLLGGRYVEISILPFSFIEYLTARNIDYSNKYLHFKTLFFDFANETSLPKGAKICEEGLDKILEYLEAIFKTIIEKDITQRHKINDKRAFINIAKFIASNIGRALQQPQLPRNSLYHHTDDSFRQFFLVSVVKV